MLIFGENSSFFSKNKPKCKKYWREHFFNFLETLVNSSATSTLQMEEVSRQYLLPIDRNRQFKRHHIMANLRLRFFFGHSRRNPISQPSDPLRQILWCTLLSKWKILPQKVTPTSIFAWPKSDEKVGYI